MKIRTTLLVVAMLLGVIGWPGLGQAAPFAYVVEKDFSASSETLRVFDSATNEQTASIPLTGFSLCDTVALHPNAPRLYVGCGFDVVVIDTSTNTISKSLHLIGLVDSLATNLAATRLYAIKTGGALAVIDTSTDTILHDYSGGTSTNLRARTITTLRNSSKVYVVAGTIDEYDPNTPTSPLRTLSIPGQSIRDAESSADSGKLFVLASNLSPPNASSVYSIDLATGAVSAPTALGMSGRTLALNNAGDKLYVASLVGSAPTFQPTIFEIDTSTLAITRTVQPTCLEPIAVSVTGSDGAIHVLADSTLGATGVPSICKIDAASFSQVAATSFGTTSSSSGDYLSTFLLPGCAGCCG